VRLHFLDTSLAVVDISWRDKTWYQYSGKLLPFCSVSLLPFAILQLRYIFLTVLTALAFLYSDYIRASIPTTIYNSLSLEGEKRTGVGSVFISPQVPFPLLPP
jgi:hypothetical protein